MVIKCGWCPKYLGVKPPLADQRISHSICKECRAKQRALLHRQKMQRVQQKRYAMRRSFMGNPGHIPGQVLEVRYKRGRSGYYKHDFKPGVRQRRLRAGESFSTRQNAVVLYHPNRPVWEDERTPGFWSRYGHGRGGSNPMARRRRSGAGGIDYFKVAMFAGIGYLIYSTFLAPGAEAGVSTGGQNILPQSSGTVWYSDPFLTLDGMPGDQSFFIGSLPPGGSPPWRLASVVEMAALNLGLAAGTLAVAGGGLIVQAI